MPSVRNKLNRDFSLVSREKNQNSRNLILLFDFRDAIKTYSYYFEKV